jgi:hypothetical protein
MLLKISLLCIGLKLSNPTSSRREAALHIFVKQIPTIDSWPLVNQIGAIISFLLQGEPLLHCWKENLGLKLSRCVATSENNHLLRISNLCSALSW